MTQEFPAMRSSLRTPRAAAIAGILFSLTLSASLALIWGSIPDDPLHASADEIVDLRKIAFALDLLPFAGIAFLWFVGVLRDRMGEREDRFFSTLLLGSGLLFLAMLFVAGALAGGLLGAIGAGMSPLLQSGAYALGRVQIYRTVHIYALRMAGVFLMSTATIVLRIRIAPPWMGYLGYVVALALVFMSSGAMQWVALAFPLWVLLVSSYILFDNLRRGTDAKEG